MLKNQYYFRFSKLTKATPKMTINPPITFINDNASPRKTTPPAREKTGKSRIYDKPAKRLPINALHKLQANQGIYEQNLIYNRNDIESQVNQK